MLLKKYMLHASVCLFVCVYLYRYINNLNKLKLLGVMIMLSKNTIDHLTENPASSM